MDSGKNDSIKSSGCAASQGSGNCMKNESSGCHSPDTSSLASQGPQTGELGIEIRPLSNSADEVDTESSNENPLFVSSLLLGSEGNLSQDDFQRTLDEEMDDQFQQYMDEYYETVIFNRDPYDSETENNQEEVDYWTNHDKQFDTEFEESRLLYSPLEGSAVSDTDESKDDLSSNESQTESFFILPRCPTNDAKNKDEIEGSSSVETIRVAIQHAIDQHCGM